MNIHRLEIDGNDGVGKSTLCALLNSFGIETKDRGLVTKISLNQATIGDLDDNVLYIILDLPAEISYERLMKSNKDMSKEFHTLNSLQKYRIIYREIFQAANLPNVRLISGNQPVKIILLDILKCLRDINANSLIIPKLESNLTSEI